MKMESLLLSGRVKVRSGNGADSRYIINIVAMASVTKTPCCPWCSFKAEKAVLPTKIHSGCFLNRFVWKGLYIRWTNGCSSDTKVIGLTADTVFYIFCPFTVPCISLSTLYLPKKKRIWNANFQLNTVSVKHKKWCHIFWLAHDYYWLILTIKYGNWTSISLVQPVKLLRLC